MSTSITISTQMKMLVNSTYGVNLQEQSRMLRNESAGICVEIIRARGTKLKYLDGERQQITADGEAKFLFGGIKRSVHIRTDRELSFLSKHLNMDLKKHFTGYFGGNTTVTPIVINCNNYLSISGDIMNNMFSGVAIFMTGETFNDKVRKALSLEAFLNPDSHLEEFV